MRSSKKVIIIGGNACGMKTAARLRRRDPRAQITVFEKGPYLSYGSCGFPYYISGMIKAPESLLGGVGSVRDAQYFRTVKDVQVFTGAEVTRIDRKNKRVEVVRSDAGTREQADYDQLVIATGGSPSVPDIGGLGDVQGVFSVTTLEDTIGIRKHIEDHDVREVVIAGGGFIGVEVAEGLAERGLQVTIVKKSEAFLPAMLDRETALLALKVMREKGVRVLTGESVVRLASDGRGLLRTAVTDTGRELPAGVILIAKGLVPNAGLARDAGLAVGDGGIAVNERLQTSDPDIYAGGDCVESIQLQTGRKLNLAMGSLANIHGRIIADNLAGDPEAFPGVLGTGIFKIFDTTVGRTGLTEREARQQGLRPVSAIVPGPDKPHFYRGAKPIIVKLIADGKSGKVLGAQILGRGEVAKRIDIVATALACGATVDQLSKINLAYSPPYSPPLDNIITAANVLKNKLSGRAAAYSPLEVKSKMDRGEDFIYLDVRSPAEFERMRIQHPSVKLLPLDRLREEAHTLPRDREIVVSCMSSLRAYEGHLILKARGFDKVRFMDGGLMAWPFDVKQEVKGGG